MNRLWVRLSLAFLLVAWLAIGAVALIVRGATETGFRAYVNQRSVASLGEGTVSALEAHYVASGSWQGAAALLPGRGEAGQGRGQGQGRGGGAEFLVADASGIVVAATDPALVGQRLDALASTVTTPLVVEGTQVGWLAQQTPGGQALGEAETRFLNETTAWLGLAALGAAVLAVIAGVALAWTLTRPLRALTEAAHDLATGELGRQVTIGGTAEVAELAGAFNRMSHDLAEGEALQQRMAADIAHELRTPVSVLRGHLEAMLDGVFPSDGAHLAVAYDHTLHLARLVDDLRLLTQAEAGRLPLEWQTVQPEGLIAQVVEGFTPLALDADITLRQDVSPGLPPVRGDVDRLRQVLGNLLSNALRHTPPGGEIGLVVTTHGEALRFAVRNTGTGLTPEQAAHVFERFWRAEGARERDRGGSGLGLAIARQLVILHGGHLWVEVEAEQTSFVFELPANG